MKETKSTINKTKVKMVFRTIAIIAFGLFVSSLVPFVYGPFAIIVSPLAVGVSIYEAIGLNKEDMRHIRLLNQLDKPATIKMEDLESMH